MAQAPKKLDPSRGPRELFGSEARFYREREGLSLRALAEMIPFSASTISEIERGDTGCDLSFAEYADDALNTGGALVRLHSALFDGRSAAFPSYFMGWPEREGEAEVLRSYQTMLVDGLLQTPAYAEVLLYGDAKKVEARMARQEILRRESPPRLVYLLPETVLWHRVGTAPIMHEQLLRLADAISPRVSIQIIPDGAPHSGHAGSFTLARFPGGGYAAYCEGEPHGKIVEGSSEIERLHEKFLDLGTYALSADQSEALIRETAENKWKT
ncbi:helix-turn-helix domain-containing protein [Actinomadura hibisca]|uniref:helix-turn-helix domain-containing protein n=1 Tax=Actinomadura hibisca TaxID=68565 RepID=UPI00082CB045|nr:helix-turn-helix transcriptional regulator [Actinomadura hibisca]